MAKLHLTSRAQAVVVAYETGLVLPTIRSYALSMPQNDADAMGLII